MKNAYDASDAECVGVILVHGIGAQKRDQHLEREVVQLARAVEKSVGGEVRLLVASKPPELCGATGAWWPDAKCCAVVVEVARPCAVTTPGAAPRGRTGLDYCFAD